MIYIIIAVIAALIGAATFTTATRSGEAEGICKYNNVGEEE